MTNLDGCEITFPIVAGIFGVGRLATKLKALADTEQTWSWVDPPAVANREHWRLGAYRGRGKH